MKLTIHLFKENVRDLDGLLEDKYVEGDLAFRELVQVGPLPFECRVYLQRTKTTPKWSSYFGRFFTLGQTQITNVANSFVAFLKVENRVFALTFGYGFHAIKRSLVEPRFGLRCALNLTDPSRIRTLDTRNVDLVTRQQRTHVSAGRPFPDFDVDPLVDWVGYIAGQTSSDGPIRNVAGADSVSITTTEPFEALGDICRILLEAFSSDQYKTRFPFVDYLTPIPQHDPIVETLNNAVISLLGQRTHERITLAYPEMPDFERIDHLKIWNSLFAMEMQDLSLSAVYDFLDANPASGDPHSIHLVALDANDAAVMHKHSLWEFLVCEVEHDGGTYILSLGQWFVADRSFVDRLHQEVRAIPDVTEQMDMPRMLGNEREDQYNARVASTKGWLTLDKKMVTVGDPYAKVEVCDLVTEGLHFIAVKKMSSSATLSHLFAQGLVSATLLKDNHLYRCSVMNKIVEKWPEKADVSAEGCMFVFAIATEKSGPLADSLFLFSRINLLEQARSIERMGYKVGLCKIAKQKPSTSVIARSKGRGGRRRAS